MKQCVINQTMRYTLLNKATVHYQKLRTVAAFDLTAQAATNYYFYYPFDIIESVILHHSHFCIAKRLKRETIYILVAACTGCLEFVIMEVVWCSLLIVNLSIRSLIPAISLLSESCFLCITEDNLAPLPFRCMFYISFRSIIVHTV